MYIPYSFLQVRLMPLDLLFSTIDEKKVLHNKTVSNKTVQFYDTLIFKNINNDIVCNISDNIFYVDPK